MNSYPETLKKELVAEYIRGVKSTSEILEPYGISIGMWPSDIICMSYLYPQ